MDEHVFIQYIPQMIGALCVISYNIYRYFFARPDPVVELVPTPIPLEEPVVDEPVIDVRPRQSSIYERLNNRLDSLIRRLREDKDTH